MQEGTPLGMVPGESRRRRPGKVSFNRGVAAVAVALAGDVIGFLFFAASSGNPGSTGRIMYFPIGGIFALALGGMAIFVGRKVLSFLNSLSPERVERVAYFMDIDDEKKWASKGVVLGVISIVINPLIIFFVLLFFR
jgi:hypothetical protein